MAQLHTDELRQNHIIITYDYLRVTFVSFITLCKTEKLPVRKVVF